METNDKNVSFITILDRAFTILDYLFDTKKAAGVSAIAKATGIPKANTFRILKTLQQLDVIQEKDSGYILGRKLIKYGNGAKQESDLVALARPHMKALCEQIRETVNLGILYEDNILILHSEDGEQTTLVSRLIPISPLYCSSIGKLYLAHMEKAEAEAYFARHELRQRTIHTLCDYAAFQKEESQRPDARIAYDHEEYEYGLTCLSTPILDHGGTLLAGLSISGPTSRLAHIGWETLETLLKTCGKAIEQDVREYDS